MRPCCAVTPSPEPELLQALNHAIHRCDPDVLIGHNIFRFDLDYIGGAPHARHPAGLGLKRGGGAHHSQFALEPGRKDHRLSTLDAYGRHIIDTYFLVQLYDIGLRSLESHGLKQVSRHFGIASDEGSIWTATGSARTS